MPDPTPADRLALAVCGWTLGPPGLCHASQICIGCRQQAAAVIRELAEQAGSAKHWHVDQLRGLATELDGHPGTAQAVQGGN